MPEPSVSPPDDPERAPSGVARRPLGSLFAGREPIAERADELLAGFGE